MKPIVIKLLIFIFVCLISFSTCFAVKIDGIDGGVEWENAVFEVLLNDTDSNNVNFGSISYIVDDNGFDLYLMIFFSDKTESYQSAGVILTLGNDSIIIDVNGDVDNPEPDLYHIDASVYVAENDGCYCEILVGYKKGLPENISGKVCYIDGDGTHSYHYPFNVENQYFTTTYTEDSDDDNDYKRPVQQNTTKQKATKPKTTKEKTTKETTTKRKTTVKLTTGRTTEPRTVILMVTDIAETVKSEPDSTKTQTARHSATKKPAEKAEDITVVYYFEKEVVLSEVYVTSNTSAPIEPVCEVYSENFIQQPNVADINAERYNQGVNIFRVVIVICGALLAVFSFSLFPRSKESDNIGADRSKTDDNNSDKTD